MFSFFVVESKPQRALTKKVQPRDGRVPQEKGDASLRHAYRTVQVQAMQHLKHIEARDRAVWLVMIIPFLALVPLTCFAQTKKSEAKAQAQPAPTPASFEGCYELKLGRWWPWGFGEENTYVTPPSRIQLLGEHGTRGFEQDKLLIPPSHAKTDRPEAENLPSGVPTLRVNWS